MHFLQNEGPKLEPVGNFTVPLPCVQGLVKKLQKFEFPAKFEMVSQDPLDGFGQLKNEKS